LIRINNSKGVKRRPLKGERYANQNPLLRVAEIGFFRHRAGQQQASGSIGLLSLVAVLARFN
jgi:hypothetical protein